MSKPLLREIAQIPYSANGFSTVQLPRGYAYRKLSFYLVANLTRSSGGSAGSVRDGAPAQLVRNIQIKADGQSVIKNMDLETLHRLSQLRKSSRPAITSMTAGYGAASSVSTEVCADLDFALWRAARAMDGVYDTANFTTLDLLITWGVGADIMSADFAGATITVNSATLYVYLEEEVGIDDNDRANMWLVNEYSQQQVIAASSSKFQIKLPVGNFYHSFVIKTMSNNVPVNTILNNFVLKAGTDTFVAQNSAVGAAFNQRINKHRLGIETWPDGYYLVDFVPDGRLSSILDTRKFTELMFECDVTAQTNSTIAVYSVELVKPAIKVAA